MIYNRSRAIRNSSFNPCIAMLRTRSHRRCRRLLITWFITLAVNASVIKLMIKLLVSGYAIDTRRAVGERNSPNIRKTIRSELIIPTGLLIVAQPIWRTAEIRLAFARRDWALAGCCNREESI